MKALKIRQAPEAATAARMRRLDRRAIDSFHMPGLLLMENAGRGAAEHIAQTARRLRVHGRSPGIIILCGKGNNGGDGMVIARHLHRQGFHVKVYLCAKPAEIAGDALTNLRILRKMRVAVKQLTSAAALSRAKDLRGAAIIVDAIFGIGFTGAPRGLISDIITIVNAAPEYVISIDVPSGLDATSGIACGACVEADETLAMGLNKTGFFRNDGPAHTGRVRQIDIGLPFKTGGARWLR